MKKAVKMTPEDVIGEIKKSNLLGRGGAGFPTGLKWEFCRREKGEAHYVVCNADEGEPGTFKDRVILTERPQLLFEGMAVAGYAVGAKEGVLYLRGEYAYLKPYLEKILADLRKKNHSREEDRRQTRLLLRYHHQARRRALMSAARNRPCSSPPRANGASRATGRPSPSNRGICSARRRSTTSKRCAPPLGSSKKAPAGSRTSGRPARPERRF